MASFAKIGLNGKVMEVVSIANETLQDSQNVERENLGIKLLTELTHWPIWKQTSYNNNFRKNFAGVGYTYDEDRDAFISPKPFTSWVLNETTCRWEAPVALPDTENRYNWNETNQTWDIIE